MPCRRVPMVLRASITAVCRVSRLRMERPQVKPAADPIARREQDGEQDERDREPGEPAPPASCDLVALVDASRPDERGEERDPAERVEGEQRADERVDDPAGELAAVRSAGGNVPVRGKDDEGQQHKKEAADHQRTPEPPVLQELETSFE